MCARCRTRVSEASAHGQHVTPLICTRKLRPLGAGFEYNLLSEVLQSARDGFELPGQLGVELHRGLKAAKFKSKEPTDAEFARLVGELRRHYQLLDRRQNGRNGKAIEVLLAKKEGVSNRLWSV